MKFNFSSKYYFISNILFFSLIIYYYLKNIKLKGDIIKLFKCVNEYEEIITDQGKKNHEYNNQLIVLEGYINDKKKLEEYLYSLIEDHKPGQNYKIRQLSNFPCGGIKELLYSKIFKMDKNNIKHYIYVSKDFGEYLIKQDRFMCKDISLVLGVFLDNAIEASILSKEKEIMMDFKTDNKYIEIKISNSFNKEKLIKKDECFNTTKGKGHGFGLRLVKDIIRRNNKMEVVTDYDDNYFVQNILIEIK